MRIISSARPTPDGFISSLKFSINFARVAPHVASGIAADTHAGLSSFSLAQSTIWGLAAVITGTNLRTGTGAVVSQRNEYLFVGFEDLRPEGGGRIHAGLLRSNASSVHPSDHNLTGCYLQSQLNSRFNLPAMSLYGCVLLYVGMRLSSSLTYAEPERGYCGELGLFNHSLILGSSTGSGSGPTGPPYLIPSTRAGALSATVCERADRRGYPSTATHLIAFPTRIRRRCAPPPLFGSGLRAESGTVSCRRLRLPHLFPKTLTLRAIFSLSSTFDGMPRIAGLGSDQPAFLKASATASPVLLPKCFQHVNHSQLNLLHPKPLQLLSWTKFQVGGSELDEGSADIGSARQHPKR
ncbi:hypothetical protein FB451DRAFT_1362909 [Mycena latifolia]|nr:hypothetical protein FB451DRAFT_1362909 [Mycena latifolia]